MSPMSRKTPVISAAATLIAAALIVMPAARVAARTPTPAPGGETVTPLSLSTAATGPLLTLLFNEPSAQGAVDVAPMTPPPSPEPPFYKRHWFWGAIGVVALTAVVIVVASSGPDQPDTNLGNMRAF